MMDAIGITELTTDPEPLDAGDGFMYERAEGLFGPHKRAVRVLIAPLADGDWSLFQRGDRVLCVLAAGVAYVVRGPLVTSSDDAATDRGTYRYIQPPVVREGAVAKSTPSVRIGGRTGGDWDQAMLYTTGSTEILRLKQMIDAVVSSAKASGDPSVSAFGAAAETAVAAKGSITGGKAAFGLYGRTSSGAKS